MSDYIVDDSMAKIIYELSDREIYNDVRAEIGIINTETVVDEDPDYAWRIWKWAVYIGGGQGFCRLRTYKADAYNAITWKLIIDDVSYHVEHADYPYYDYTCVID